MPREVDLPIEIVPCLGLEAVGEVPRLLEDEVAVEEGQRLRRDGRDVPTRGGPRRVAQVEDFQQRHEQRPLGEGIHRPPGSGPLIVGRPDRGLVGVALEGLALG